ncbi:hypothetical protein DL96DRAFT_108675 [Flagelloscypha sp. PMI_526]|nr:hypothetical protein DL96DRAFT_108675 [Flagelloscypha sp. PMI_526]
MSWRIFLGAPTFKDLTSNTDSTSSEWEWTVHSNRPQSKLTPPSPRSDYGPLASPSVSQEFHLPASVMNEAHRRISDLYQNVIFDETEVSEDLEDEDSQGSSVSNVSDETSFISWPPTYPKAPKPVVQDTSKSFLLNDSSDFMSKSAFTDMETQYETQYTDSNISSGDPSISHFPQFHFALSELTPLGRLVRGSDLRGVSVLLAVLEVDGPETITIKNGKDAGKEVALLKMILGDEESKICKLTAWREVAEAWGGLLEENVAVKRGDVILLQNISISSPSSSTSPTITASPFMRSKVTICYRTLPINEQDSVFRPDLRLGKTEACVQKVAELVAWFEDMAGLA